MRIWQIAKAIGWRSKDVMFYCPGAKTPSSRVSLLYAEVLISVLGGES